MKRMLINGTQPEELRIAMVDGQQLYDLYIESTAREQKKSNIYKGRVVRVEPSLEAAFIDYGAGRHGFLPFREVSFSDDQNNDNREGKTAVKDKIEEGQEFVIQIEKEERGNKGAALTTFVSLAGRYLILMPNNPRAGGVSRQIEGGARSEAKELMSTINAPKGMGLILRTAGVGISSEELQWDLDYLLQLWDAINTAANSKPSPFLIYQEREMIICAIRDYLRKEINEVWVDDADIHKRMHDFMEQVMPYNLDKLKLYEDSDSLFNRYQIETQIESAFSREVRLPSGGVLIIDHTEALTSIDINSAKATAFNDIEETAMSTNLEAVDEIARQLRLRDLGGLIIIDFIDMVSAHNQRQVENRLKEQLRMDRARVQTGGISRFGLLEMSRQRLRPSLGESSHIPCPRCNGQGSIRDIESLALSVLRIIEEDAIKDLTAKIIARLPIGTATFLLNEKRSVLNDIEHRHDVNIVLIPDASMETPQFQVERIRISESSLEEHNKASYDLPIQSEEDKNDVLAGGRRKQEIQQPLIKPLLPDTPAPSSNRKKTGIGIVALFKKLFGLYRKNDSDKDNSRESSDQRRRYAKSNANRSRQRRGRNRRRNGEQNRRGSESGNNARLSGQRPDKRAESRSSESGNRGRPSGQRPDKRTESRSSESGNRARLSGQRRAESRRNKNEEKHDDGAIQTEEKKSVLSAQSN